MGYKKLKMSTYNITNTADLTTLDNNLRDNLYIGGHNPNCEDVLVFELFTNAKTEPVQDTHPNLWGWFALVSLYNQAIRDTWREVKPKAAPVKKAETKKPEAKKPEPKKPEPKKAAADDDMDLFGDDDGDDAAALEEMKKKKEQEKKKAKPAIIAKSLILLEIKVW